MAFFPNSNAVTRGLICGYDMYNTAKSFRGQPTTNSNRQESDYTGTQFFVDDEWTSDPSRLSRTFFSTMPTPIGTGATRITENGTAGYHHLSRMGGGGTGNFAISCYVYPLAAITDFTIGLLGDGGNGYTVFNLSTVAVTSSSGSNSFIERVPGWPGWLRLGVTIPGRVGGWVGAVGYSIASTYTGTSGGKPCFITGVQYESAAVPSAYVRGTRSNTQALIDLTNNNTITASSLTYASNNTFSFNGSSNTLHFGNISSNFTGDLTAEVVIRLNAGPSDWVRIVGTGGNSGNRTFGLWYSTSRTLLWQRYGAGDPSMQPANVLATGTWYHIAATTQGSSHTIYLNGDSISTGSGTGPWAASGENVTVGFAGFHTYINGNVPQVRLYNRALGAAEIKQNFNSLRGRYGI